MQQGKVGSQNEAPIRWKCAMGILTLHVALECDKLKDN